MSHQRAPERACLGEGAVGRNERFLIDCIARCLEFAGFWEDMALPDRVDVAVETLVGWDIDTTSSRRGLHISLSHSGITMCIYKSHLSHNLPTMHQLGHIDFPLRFSAALQTCHCGLEFRHIVRPLCRPTPSHHAIPVHGPTPRDLPSAPTLCRPVPDPLLPT